MTMPTSYRAVQFRRYGGPEVLEVTEVPVRPPGRGEVGVRVLASSVNHLDAIHRAGGLRLLDGVRFPRGTGADFIGEVVAVGDGVDQVVGARVWGYLGMRVPRPTGAAAERLVVDQTAVSRAPRDHDLPACAALPLVGLTALQVLRDVLGVSRGTGCSSSAGPVASAAPPSRSPGSSAPPSPRRAVPITWRCAPASGRVRSTTRRRRPPTSADSSTASSTAPARTSRPIDRTCGAAVAWPPSRRRRRAWSSPPR